MTPPEPPRSRGLVARLDGKGRRTIRLPPELDQCPEAWCAEQGSEVSHAIAKVMCKMLVSRR